MECGYEADRRQNDSMMSAVCHCVVSAAAETPVRAASAGRRRRPSQQQLEASDAADAADGGGRINGGFRASVCGAAGRHHQQVMRHFDVPKPT
jgi:hypothetical protein